MRQPQIKILAGLELHAGTEATASVALGLGLGVPSQVSIDSKIFYGSALCKIKMALSFQTFKIPGLHLLLDSNRFEGGRGEG